MAKVRGALFSLNASGQLGDALVYGRWKGEAYAREYVIPTNPRTPAQEAQRAAVKQAVSFWQLPQLAEYVRAAFNRAASRVATAMSGSNLATRSWLAFRKAESDSNVALSGIAVYAGTTVADMVALTGITATGTIGLALSLTKNSGGTSVTITGAANDDGDIVTTRSLVLPVTLSGYNYIRVVAVTTDGASVIDLTGIVAVSDIAVSA